MNSKERRKENIIRTLAFLGASALIHLVLFFGFIFMNDYLFYSELFKRLDHTLVDKTDDLSAQIELVDLKEKSKQIVEQSDSKKSDTPPEDSKFLSKENQKVEKQTKARKNGAFQNRQTSAPLPQTSNSQAQNPSKPQEYKTAKEMLENPKKSAGSKSNPSDLGLKGLDPSKTTQEIFEKRQAEQKRLQQAQEQQRQASQSSPSQSQTDDYLEDIKEGDFTMLSTRRFKHYSFYSRVKSQLRSRWNPLIRQEVYFIYSTKRSLASLNKKRTTLRVTLNKNGYLEQIELLTTSGNKEIDNAAIQAFRTAAPFPNPPQDLLEKDGTIKLFWDFVLET